MSWSIIEHNHDVKARKDHQCYLCNGMILKGTVYVSWTGKDNGDPPLTTRVHKTCLAFTSGWDAMDWESFSQGGLDPVTGGEK